MPDEAKKRKRESDKARDRTRVTIGTAFTRWRALKDTFGYNFDSQLAIFLLDYYQKRQVTSTPSKGHTQPPPPPVSSISEESDRDGLFPDALSSSEFIVDEECLLQLFSSCRRCHRRCSVGKRATGLKLVVDQACGFCESRSEWTNLPDGDDGGDDDNDDSAKL